MLRLAESLGIFDLIVIGRGRREHRGPLGVQRGAARQGRGGLPRADHLRGGPRDRLHAVRLRRRPRAETPSAAAELISSEFVRFAERTESAAAGRRVRPRGGHGPRPRARRPRPLAPAAPLARRPRGARLPAARRHVEPARLGAALAGPVEPPAGSRTLHRGWTGPPPRPAWRSARTGCSPSTSASMGRARGPSSTGGSRSCATQKGGPVTRRAGIAAGQRLEAEFADGRARFARKGIEFSDRGDEGCPSMVIATALDRHRGGRPAPGGVRGGEGGQLPRPKGEGSGVAHGRRRCGGAGGARRGSLHGRYFRSDRGWRLTALAGARRHGRPRRPRRCARAATASPATAASGPLHHGVPRRCRRRARERQPLARPGRPRPARRRRGSMPRSAALRRTAFVHARRPVGQGDPGAKAILGAIVPFGGSTWFFKLTGSGAQVRGSRAAFIDFLHTVKAP